MALWRVAALFGTTQGRQSAVTGIWACQSFFWRTVPNTAQHRAWEDGANRRPLCHTCRSVYSLGRSAKENPYPATHSSVRHSRHPAGAPRPCRTATPPCAEKSKYTYLTKSRNTRNWSKYTKLDSKYTKLRLDCGLHFIHCLLVQNEDMT